MRRAVQQIAADEAFQALDEADALLAGRRTYAGRASYWPAAGGAMADRMNAFREYVVTSTDAPLEWADSTRLSGLGEVAEPDGTLLVTGSPTLVRGLLAGGLLDEPRLVVDPVVAGSGARLFETPGSFERVACRPFPSGRGGRPRRPAVPASSGAAGSARV
ncbi:dihydrofolate reductase family protein [Spirillospora sp. CA-108201]